MSFTSRSGLLIPRLLVLVAAVCAPLTIGRAQSVGAGRGDSVGSGGGRSIQGRVYSPTGSLPGARVRVTLDSPDAGTRTTFADYDGVFIFNNLEGGVYQITVEAGSDYEIAHESVNLEGAALYKVPIYLRMKAGAASGLVNVPKAAVDLYNQGLESARKGDHKKAVEHFNSALAINPNFPAALGDLGLEYLKLNQMDKAAETYAALLKLKPDDSVAHLNLGIALFNQKKLDEAETHLRESVKLNGSGPSAHYYTGLILVSRKHYDEAQTELELAIKNGGENLALAHKYLGGLYMSAKKNKEAAAELERYLKLDPKAADAERIRGTIKELRSKL